MEPGATKVTVALALPGVAETDVGAPGATALAVYVRLAGFVSEPLFVGVSVTVPATVGVTVNVWAADELLKVFTTGDRPAEPEPDGVRVMVPVYGLFGVTTKLADAALTLPLEGPVNVKAVAVGLEAV